MCSGGWEFGGKAVAAACQQNLQRLTHGTQNKTHPQLAGAAKLPYLAIEPQTLDLGRVQVGRRATASVRIGNLSPVVARFRVEPEDAAAAAGLAPLVAGGGSSGSEGLFDVSPQE